MMKHVYSTGVVLLALAAVLGTSTLSLAEAGGGAELVAHARGMDMGGMVASSSSRDGVDGSRAVDSDASEENAGRGLFYVAPKPVGSATTRPPSSYGGFFYVDHKKPPPKCPECGKCDCSLPKCPEFDASICPPPTPGTTCDSFEKCPDLFCPELICPAKTGDVTCVLPPVLDASFTPMAPVTDPDDGRLCNATRNTCCAHGTKCNFGPSIDMIDDDTTEVCVPNGIPNQCCVETDDGEGSSTKAIGFIAAKIPESNGTVGVNVTAPDEGLEQLKNLACYCCEGTLAIQHVEDNMNITVDELKTATCQKKGFTGCNNATAGSIKVRAAGDPMFDVCALCPFTADAHCKNETEACVFDVDCCEGLTCSMTTNTCTTPLLPPAGRDATALEGDARKRNAAAGRSQAAGRGAATPTAASRGSASSRTTGTAGGARDTAVTYDYVGGRGAVPSASAARGGLQASTAAAAAGRGRAI